MRRPPKRTGTQNAQFRDHGRPRRVTLEQWLDDYMLRQLEARRRSDDFGGGRSEWGGI